MTAKGFLNKANKTNLSAQGFLEQYRDYMTKGELAYVLSPIVAKVDSGELLPTPARVAIANATMYHVIAADTIKAEKAIEDQNNPQSSAAKKNWTATIFDSKDVIQVRMKANGEEEELVKGFEVSGDADKWVDRRLALDGASDWYGVIQHTHSNVRVIITRDDANARFYKMTKGPSMKPQSKSTGKLSFGAHVKETRSSFSRG
jgi:hypothetical protein